MPLTPFQRAIARTLAANRNPDSHLAGGAMVNRADNSLGIQKISTFFTMQPKVLLAARRQMSMS